MAKFIMRRIPAGMGKGNLKYYPHLVRAGGVTLDEIADDISGASTFTPGDVKGVVIALAERIARNVARGYTVSIEGIGSFRASLAVEKDAEPETAESTSRRNAASVSIGDILFRADPTLVKDARRESQLERIMPRKKNSDASAPTAEERERIAREYLAKNPWMGVKDYARLCHLSHTGASLELRAIAARPDSFLDTRGSGSHKVYILRG